MAMSIQQGLECLSTCFRLKEMPEKGAACLWGESLGWGSMEPTSGVERKDQGCRQQQL